MTQEANSKRNPSHRGPSVAAIVGALAVVGMTASFLACGSKKGGSSAPRPQPQFPEAPTSGTLPQPGTPGANEGAAASMDGTWKFVRFECAKGTLTPWARVENDLVDDNGLPTPPFQWPTEAQTGTFDQGVIKRSHIWKITGDKATRESRLEFVSNRPQASRSPVQSSQSVSPQQQAGVPAAPGEATAYASTTKAYTMTRQSDGRLVMVHGKLEGPFYKGLPLEPINSVIQAKLQEAIDKGGVVGAVATSVRNMQNFLRARLGERWVQSLFSFVNDVTEATETVTMTLSGSTMSWSGARVTIKGAPTEPGVRLVDVTVCGKEGEAVRVYERLDPK